MSKTTYFKTLQSLRESKGLSQTKLAEYLSLSRMSYIGLEKGRRELTLKEALRVTKLYNITIDDLICNTLPDYNIYKEMIISFLRLAATDKKSLKKTKLARLLYLADMSHYYVAGKSISGLMYQKYSFGPVTDIYFRLIDEMEQDGSIVITQIIRDDYHMYEIKETRLAKRHKISTLTAKSETQIKKVWEAWSEASTAEIESFTNNHIPYKETSEGETINYELAKMESPHTII